MIRNYYRISTEIKYISKGLVIQKQVKNNAGKYERRFGCHLDDIFKFKMIADKLKKKSLANETCKVAH